MRTLRAVDGRKLQPVFEELQSIYREASQVQNSLASQLAQHRGLLQFSTDFENRAPPLELRVLLPQLEATIEQLLETLQASIAALQTLDLDGGSAEEVRDSLQGCLLRGLCESRETFDEQRMELRRGAAASPLFSPLTCPRAVLGKRLAAALGSPSLSSVTTASPSMTSVGAASPPEPGSAPADCGSPQDDSRMPPLALESPMMPEGVGSLFALSGLPREDGERETRTHGKESYGPGPRLRKPFSCIFEAEVEDCTPGGVSATAPGGGGSDPFLCVFAATSDLTRKPAFR